jgi:hypothetical protein
MGFFRHCEPLLRSNPGFHAIHIVIGGLTKEGSISPYSDINFGFDDQK